MMITLFSSILGRIIQGAGSRIAIRANEVGARRLHLSDFTERRSGIIREARNTKASTQGYAKDHLACAAAA